MTPGPLEPGNRTRDKLVGGERSHHCAIPAPQSRDGVTEVWLRYYFNDLSIENSAVHDYGTRNSNDFHKIKDCVLVFNRQKKNKPSDI